MPWHQWIKYLVYGALALNIFFFFRDEWLASAHTFGTGIPLAEIISAFAASIDTATWVLLLLMFEVETYQLPRERITPRLAATFRIIRGGCYAFICYAFYGYLSKAIGLFEFVPFGGDPCALASEGYSLMIELDKYLPFEASMCADAASAAGFQTIAGSQILAEQSVLDSVRKLAWVDVINSGTWILVVVLLEIDVWLQERNRLSGMIEEFSKLGKVVLYSVLLGAAIYWGVAGPFLDFWDAFLWLFAFVFIELNVFGFEPVRDLIEDEQSYKDTQIGTRPVKLDSSRE